MRYGIRVDVLNICIYMYVYLLFVYVFAHRVWL